MANKTARLGDLATYINGYAFKPADWGETGLPIIRIQDLTGNSYQLNRYDGEYPERIEVNNGDVLISWSASLGVYVWQRGKALLNQHIFKVVFDKLPVNKDYFVFAVEHKLAEMESKTHGATMKHIVKKDFDGTTIPYPPIEKQAEIADHLRRITSLIDRQTEQLLLLDQLVKSRFIELFGDPIANQFGWDTTNIGAIVTEVRYGTSRPAVENGKYPYLRMNNLTFDGHLDLKDLKRIDIPEEEIEKCIVRKGDVLFNRTNSVELVGKTCVFDLDEEMVIAGYIIRVRLGQKMIPTVFSAFMNSQPIKELFRGMAKGAVNQANINAQELQSIRIYLPPIDLQEQFAAFVEQTDKSKYFACQTLSFLLKLANNLQSWREKQYDY